MYPRSPADLTAAGVSLALGLDPRSVSSIETEVVGQGIGIYGQLVRVRLSYRAGAAGPKSVIAKFPCHSACNIAPLSRGIGVQN